MNFKRGLFVGALFVLFLCCYHIMNKHYDELSRYQYANDDNRDLILEYMNSEEINYLIERQYQPNEFMNYLGIEDFTILRLEWYNYAKSIEKLSDKEVVDIINQLSKKMTFSEFKIYCENYSIEQLYSFYYKENSFVDDLSLIFDFTTIDDKIDDTMTLFTYEPNDLVKIEDVPVVNQNKGKDYILLREDSENQLNNMCLAAFEINEKTCGNMVVIDGYVSFDEQEVRYEDALLVYGVDDVKQYVDFPGQSIYQLGTVIKMIPVGYDKNEETNQDDEEEVSKEISIQQTWLREHAQEYGFKFLNDSDEPLKEFVLKYVGLIESNATE